MVGSEFDKPDFTSDIGHIILFWATENWLITPRAQGGRKGVSDSYWLKNPLCSFSCPLPLRRYLVWTVPTALVDSWPGIRSRRLVLTTSWGRPVHGGAPPKRGTPPPCAPPCPLGGPHSSDNFPTQPYPARICVRRNVRTPWRLSSHSSKSLTAAIVACPSRIVMKPRIQNKFEIGNPSWTKVLV